MAEITWTDEAQRWLEDIYGYIAADDPRAAARTVQGIYGRAQDLTRFPEIGHRYLHRHATSASSFMATIASHILIKDDGNIDIGRYRL